MKTLILSIETMHRLYKASTSASVIYQGINSKFRQAKYKDLVTLLNCLHYLREYTFANIGVNPPITTNTIKHNHDSIRMIDKAKQALKTLNLTLPASKRNNNFIYCRDTLDIFKGHIQQMINRGAK